MTNTETIENAAPKDFGWVLLELMGHRQRIGQAREEEIAGSKLLRLDIPTDTGKETPENYVTEYYGANAIYAMRPISAEVARDHWANTDPRPSRPAEYKPATRIEDHSDDEEDLDDLPDDF